MKKAKTAYDMRRYITLVQVLATDTPSRGAIALCEAWGVTPGAMYTETVRRLARHAIDYHRTEDDAPTDGSAFMWTLNSEPDDGKRD